MPGLNVEQCKSYRHNYNNLLLGVGETFRHVHQKGCAKIYIQSVQDTTASRTAVNSANWLWVGFTCLLQLARSLQHKVQNKDSQKLMAVMQLHTSSHSIPGHACLQSTSEHMPQGRVFSKTKLSNSTLERSTSCSCCLLACQLQPSWGEQRPWAWLQPLP